MRRGEPKATGLKRERRTYSFDAKLRTRAGDKDASPTTLLNEVAAKARELTKTIKREASISHNIARLKRSLAEAHQREAVTTSRQEA